MDPNLRDELTAWLEFYRELGFESFSVRPRENQNPQVATRRVEAKAPRPEIAPARLDAGLGQLVPKPASSAAPIPAPSVEQTSRPAAPTPPPSTPASLPAQPLSLFEAPVSPPRERETLEQIREDLGDCHRCKLAGGRKTIVFGQGNPRAEVVFVGEGPGADEDEQGLPFVGRAGQLLNRMFKWAGMNREDVYICNIVKCRPPGNRVPEKDEIETCSPFLFRQIESIRPRVVCCLGAPAVRTLLGLKEGITKIRGQFYDFRGTKALIMVHPAYVLRNPREEKVLREDFEKLLDFLRGSHST